MSRKTTFLALVFLLTLYLGATLPYLGDYPQFETAQGMISAPAYKLAVTGVYGSDMYRGFFGADRHNYDHMPLYALPMAAVFRLFGPGILYARLLSVFYGALVLLLTFRLGQQLVGREVGVMAAASLCLLRLGHVPESSGIPLFDIARLVRFDVLVPVWVLAALITFHWAYLRRKTGAYFLVGLLGGLAGLTHVYGFFVLVAPVLVLLWQEGRRALKRPFIPLIVAGFLTAVLPYLIYVAQDPAGYRGQMLRHSDRLDFFNPQFYLDNLLHEPWRFLPWLGGSFRQAVLWPRLGIWLLVVGVAVANVLLWRRVRQTGRVEDRLLLLALPTLWLLLATTILYKRYVYVMLLLPFFALELGVTAVWFWPKVRPYPAARLGAILLALLLMGEAAWGVWQNFQYARTITPYGQLTADLQAIIPPEERVMANSEFWLAFNGYDFYSLDLLFVQTAERFHDNPAPTVADILNRIAPDTIVVNEALLKQYLLQPEAAPRAELNEQWRGLDAYLMAHCAGQVQAVETIGYGRLLIQRCSTH